MQHGKPLPRPAKRYEIVPLPEFESSFKTIVIRTENGPAVEEADLLLLKINDFY